MASLASNRRPALGDRALFPELSVRAYLSHAAVSPASLWVQAAVERMLGLQARLGQGMFPEAELLRGRVRQKLGLLLGTRAENVALVSGTSHALSHLALGFPWRSGDGVVLFQGEFPANVTPWREAARLYGLEVHWLSLAGAERDPDRVLGALEARLKQGARLVAVSAVQFQTGLCMPLREMAELCHRHGAEIAVDAIQAAGVVPFEMDAWGLDYVAGGAHKWLMGIEGAGYLAIHPARVRALKPVTAGWLSHEHPIEFLLGGADRLDYERPLVESARVFEAGSGSVLGCAALEAALDAILELGVSAIFEHVTCYLDQLQVGLEARGLSHVRASHAQGRSAILSLRLPANSELAAVALALRARGIACGTPDGFLRFAPHFPNSLDEIPDVLAALDACLAGTSARVE